MTLKSDANFEEKLTCGLETQKSREELSFMTLKGDANFEEKIIFGLENDMRNLTNFHQSESLKTGISWDPSMQSRKCMSLKVTEELCVVTMKNDAKFEEELTF